jgi:hypothetical protein
VQHSEILRGESESLSGSGDDAGCDDDTVKSSRSNNRNGIMQYEKG